MTDIAAPATAEPSSTPVETSAPAPAGPETSRIEALDKAPTLDSSIDNAFDKVFGDEAKPEGKAYERDEAGRFTAKAAEAAAKVEQAVAVAKDAAQPQEQPQALATAFDAPTRFSADAKAAWTATPDPVKAEINRAVSEMEKGLQDYQTRYAPLKPYEDMAKQYGTTIEAALQNYTNMETMFQTDPKAGFAKICEYIGKTPQQFIAELSGQQAAPQLQQDQTISELRQTIARLEQQVSGVSTSIQSQNEAAVEAQIQVWAADKPRFTELRETMSQLAQSGMANDLDEAYAMAERLKPAPAPAIVAPKPDLKAQTQKGSLSTTGAPVSGSNPAFRKPASSPAEAVDRAFAQIGFG